MQCNALSRIPDVVYEVDILREESASRRGMPRKLATVVAVQKGSWVRRDDDDFTRSRSLTGLRA